MSETKLETATKQAAAGVARRDPANRHADGAAWGTEISNREKNTRYILVSMNPDALHGPDFYEELGYKKVINREGGPKLRGGNTSKRGDQVEFRGHVLMSIGAKEADELRMYGAPGAGSGLSSSYARDKKLFKREQRDLLRGVALREHMDVNIHENVDVGSQNL